MFSYAVLARSSRILCPLTRGPFGHDNQRRHAEQRRLAPRYPARAPPGHRRHPAGDRPGSVNHDMDRRERGYSGDITLGILRPGYTGHIRCCLLLPLPASRQKYVTSLCAFKGAISSHRPSAVACCYCVTASLNPGNIPLLI